MILNLECSTRYRRMGFDIIGMTAIPEAKLAREAEIAYLAKVFYYYKIKTTQIKIKQQKKY